MVSSTMSDNISDAPSIKVSTVLGAPPGDYRLVGWDMDATGKKVVDEICHIAVYTPGCEYSQYVMPFKDLTQPAKKRHHIHVVASGPYRVLKNCYTKKVLRTKSEISALRDFLEWLEKIKGDTADGVILVHHEPRPVNPAMLIEALTKYKLLDRFKQTVKGFANGFDVAKAKCADTLKAFSLRTLSRVFLKKQEELCSATNRARLALQVVEHLCVGEKNDKAGEEISNDDSHATTKATVEFIREFVQSVDAAEEDCAALKIVFARQDTLQPIFKPLLSVMVRRERQHTTSLRRLLAESAIDYSRLQQAWSDGQREGLKKLLKETTIENKNAEDLIEIIACHFDPEETLPPPSYEGKKNRKKVKSEKKKDVNVSSEPQSPDTTFQSPVQPEIVIKVEVPDEELLKESC